MTPTPDEVREIAEIADKAIAAEQAYRDFKPHIGCGECGDKNWQLLETARQSLENLRASASAPTIAAICRDWLAWKAVENRGKCIN